MPTGEAKKLEDAAQEGDVTADIDTPIGEICCVCQKSGVMMRCGACKSGKYCSKRCQRQHYPHHVEFCSAISELEKLELNKLYKDYSIREEQIDSKTRSKFVKLVGEKPMLKCHLDGSDFDVLWDTGSMVSLVDKNWVKRHFPETSGASTAYSCGEY